MYLADSNLNIPKQWEHDPTIQDIDGNTVAMLLANNGKIPSK